MKDSNKKMHPAHYLEDGVRFSVPFNYCPNCKTFIRQVDDQAVLSHLKAASHTDLRNEELLFKMRISFFRYLFNLVKKTIMPVKSWLDFGCSYGHLLEFLKEKGIESYGIEISGEVREHARQKNLTIYSTVDELPAEKKFDVVSLVDSLYYLNDPVALMKKIHESIRQDGLVIIRITNRNWLVKLRRYFAGDDMGLAIGDATLSYSKKSIIMLLDNSGFRILRITSKESGKSMEAGTRLFYHFAAIVRHITFNSINISPGLIIIAQKRDTR